jgi:MSHA biogenesis protein MshQ
MRWLPALVFTLLGLLGGGIAQATDFNFDSRDIGGCDYTAATKTYSCPTTTLKGNDTIIIPSGYTLVINGTFAFGFNQGLVMKGTARFVTTGSLSIADMKAANLEVTGGSIEAGGTFYMGALTQSMTANVKAANVQLGSDNVTINGSITATGTVSIASYSKIYGNVSGATISTSSSVTISGNVTATSKLTLGHASTVGGNVDSGDLVLQAANALIGGSASVNYATLEWGGRVTGTIACKNGTAKDKCDCVTNNSGYAINTTSGPRCTGPVPPAAAGVHHFLVTHDGEGDTCLPEKITVTACANASCTAPHYTGTVSGTLAPFGDGFTISEGAGSVVVNATSIAARTVDLDVSSTSSTSAPASCYRSSNNTTSCAMSFTGGTKLKLTVPGHAAGADQIKALVEAVKANDDASACVAAFKDASYQVQYSCNYSKPKTGTQPLAFGDKTLSCAASSLAATAQGVSTKFDAAGRASIDLKYADAGELTLNALLEHEKGVAKGEGKLTTAPASFRIEPAAGTIRAGADFALKITALNVAGAVTPNFDNNDLNNALAIKHGVTLGVACHKQGGSLGAVTPASPAFTDGVAGVTATWSDVGNIDLVANLADFLGTGLAATGSTNTLGAGNCSGALGPFIPAYYRLTLTDTRGWYYSGEPLPLLVSAMNKAGALTLNYKGTLSEAVTLSVNDKTGAAFAPAPGALSTTTVAAADFANGVAAVKPAYAFSAWPGAPTQIRLRASNGKAGGSDVSSVAPPAAEEAMPVIRTGRLRLGSRFGGLKTTL